MTQAETLTDTGLLIHGRHLQAVGWEEMMWGGMGPIWKWWKI